MSGKPDPLQRGPVHPDYYRRTSWPIRTRTHSCVVKPFPGATRPASWCPAGRKPDNDIICHLLGAEWYWARNGDQTVVVTGAKLQVIKSQGICKKTLPRIWNWKYRLMADTRSTYAVPGNWVGSLRKNFVNGSAAVSNDRPANQEKFFDDQ